MTERVFVAKPGQIDFSNARYAPVINIVITKDNRVLLVQRSHDLRLYPDYWNGISGFLDDNKSIEEKVSEELSEELSISKNNIESVKIGQLFLQEAPEYNKTWLVVPILAVVNTDQQKLNWEAQNAKWFTLAEIRKLKLLPGFDQVLKQFVKMI